MGEARDGHRDVTGEYKARVGPMTWGRIALGVAWAVAGAVQLADDHVSIALLWWATATLWLAMAAVGQRGRTLVDADGVVVKAVSRTKRMSWDEVNFTTSAPSTHWPPADLTLRAKNGRELPTHVPALRWAEVKAYGELHRSVQDQPSRPT